MAAKRRAKKEKCPYCKVKYHEQGIGPHKAHCPKRPQNKTEAAVTTGSGGRTIIFERGRSKLFHCPWCSQTTTNAQGMGTHALAKHKAEYLAYRLKRGYKVRAAAAIIKVSPVSRMRGKMQEKEIGVDLTKVPLDKLALVPQLARNELEARYKELLAAF